MQGVAMGETIASSISLAGDRRVAFSVAGAKGTSTLLDTTQFHGLLRYRTRFDNPADAKNSEIIVTTPEGIELGAEDPRFLERIEAESGKILEIVRLGRALYHSMPVSLMGTASVAAIEQIMSAAVDHRAFRQNGYLATNFAYVEDTWVGRTLEFGDEPGTARLAVIKLDKRCATINLNPTTGESNPAVLRAVAKHHNNTLGVYCTIVGEGVIVTGAPVYIVG